MPAPETIRADPAPRCYLCQAEGLELYPAVRDRVSTAPGEWRLRRCGRCRLVWLDPRPVPEDVPKLYARYYTHTGGAPLPPPGRAARIRDLVARLRLRYPMPPAPPFDRLLARVLAWTPPGRAAGDAHVMRLPPPTPGARLLDVGCGDGAFLARMRDLGWAVTGVEPDPVAADIAGGRHGLDVHVGSLETARLPAGAFQAVTLGHVIEHVNDPIGTLSECRRILAPGGVVSILTPNEAALARRLYAAAWLHWDPPRHLFVFSRESLAACAERAGLRVASLTTTARAARWAFGASRVIRREGAFLDAAPGRLPGRDRVAGAFLALAEHAVLPMAPGLGEELFLLAQPVPAGTVS